MTGCVLPKYFDKEAEHLEEVSRKKKREQLAVLPHCIDSDSCHH